MSVATLSMLLEPGEALDLLLKLEKNRERDFLRNLFASHLAAELKAETKLSDVTKDSVIYLSKKILIAKLHWTEEAAAEFALEILRIVEGLISSPVRRPASGGS